MVKLHFNHLSDRRVSIDDIVPKFPQARFLLLYRESILAQYCSQKLATKTRAFTGNAGNTESSFCLDIADWESYRSAQLRAFQSARLALESANKPLRVVSYEGLVAGPERVITEKLYPFLGLTSRAVNSPKLRKQEKRTFEEIIANYSDVQQKIMPYASYSQLEIDSWQNQQSS